MFDHMYEMGFLSETPKIHILYAHLGKPSKKIVDLMGGGNGEFLTPKKRNLNLKHLFKGFLLEQYLDIQKREAEERGEQPRSLALGDCQGLEACHSGLRKSDIRHGAVVQHHQVCSSDSAPPSVCYQHSLFYILKLGF